MELDSSPATLRGQANSASRVVLWDGGMSHVGQVFNLSENVGRVFNLSENVGQVFNLSENVGRVFNLSEDT